MSIKQKMTYKIHKKIYLQKLGPLLSMLEVKLIKMYCRNQVLHGNLKVGFEIYFNHVPYCRGFDAIILTFKLTCSERIARLPLSKRTVEG